MGFFNQNIMVFVESITAEFEIQNNKEEYALNYDKLVNINGANILNLIIRPADADGFRKTELNKDICSNETLLSGYITLVSKNSGKELIKDLPLEYLFYRADGDFKTSILLDKIDLSASKIRLKNIAAGDVGKAIEITFVYS